MSMCEYCEKGSYYGFCTCVKSNNICPFMRRCNMEHKWLPIDAMNTCNLRLPETEVVLKQGEYLVRFEKNGELYIEIDNYVVVKKNPFDYVPTKVELVRVDNEMYIKGFEPKQKEEPVKKTKRTKNK